MALTGGECNDITLAAICGHVITYMYLTSQQMAQEREKWDIHKFNGNKCFYFSTRNYEHDIQSPQSAGGRPIFRLFLHLQNFLRIHLIHLRFLFIVLY